MPITIIIRRSEQIWSYAAAAVVGARGELLNYLSENRLFATHKMASATCLGQKARALLLLMLLFVLEAFGIRGSNFPLEKMLFFPLCLLLSCSGVKQCHVTVNILMHMLRCYEVGCTIEQNSSSLPYNAWFYYFEWLMAARRCSKLENENVSHHIALLFLWCMSHTWQD